MSQPGCSGDPIDWRISGFSAGEPIRVQDRLKKQITPVTMNLVPDEIVLTSWKEWCSVPTSEAREDGKMDYEYILRVKDDPRGWFTKGSLYRVYPNGTIFDKRGIKRTPAIENKKYWLRYDPDKVYIMRVHSKPGKFPSTVGGIYEATPGHRILHLFTDSGVRYNILNPPANGWARLVVPPSKKDGPRCIRPRWVSFTENDMRELTNTAPPPGPPPSPVVNPAPISKLPTNTGDTLMSQNDNELTLGLSAPVRVAKVTQIDGDSLSSYGVQGILALIEQQRNSIARLKGLNITSSAVDGVIKRYEDGIEQLTEVLDSEEMASVIGSRHLFGRQSL